MPASNRRPRRSRRHSAEQKNRLLGTHLVFLLIVSVFLLAGAAPTAAAVISLAVASLGAWFIGRRSRPTRLSAILFAMGLWTLATTAPLPAPVLSVLSPLASEIWKDLPNGATPWRSISLDPLATLLESAKWFAASLIALTSNALSRRGGLNWILHGVLWISLSLVLSLVVHTVFSIELLGGLYRPTDALAGTALTPLLNPNNLAGFLILGTFSSLALFERATGPVRKGFLLGAVILAGAVYSTHSRAGIVCLAGGAILGVYLNAPGLSKAEPSPFTRKPVLFGASILTIGAGFWLGPKWLQPDADKLRILSQASTAIRDFPLVGIGRGSFESVSPRYVLDSGGMSQTHIENFLLSWCIEWGIPAFLFFLLGLGWTLAPVLKTCAKRPDIRWICLGLGALCVQNLADLALELPGILFSTVALVGGLSDRNAQETRRTGGFPKALALTVLALSTAYLLTGDGGVGDARKRLAGLYADKSNSPSQVHTQAIAEMRKRPAESYFPLMAGLVSLDNSGRVIPWVSAVLRRSPNNARAHWVIAHHFQREHRLGQAVQNIHRAVSLDPSLSATAARDLLSWTRDEQMLVRTAPGGRVGGVLLLHLSQQAARKENPTLALSLLRRSFALAPDELPVLEAYANSILRELTSGDPSCFSRTENECAQRRGELQNLIQKLETSSPGRCFGPILRSRYLVAEGKSARAIGLLKRTCDQCSERELCYRAAVEIAHRHAHDQIQILEDRLLAISCEGECIRDLDWLAGEASKRSDWSRALELAQRAAVTTPSRERLQLIVNIAGEAGDPIAARLAIEKKRRFEAQSSR